MANGFPESDARIHNNGGTIHTGGHRLGHGVNGIRYDQGATQILARDVMALLRDLVHVAGVEDFIDEAMTLYGVEHGRLGRLVSEVIEALDLGVYADTPVAALSGGWRRRVEAPNEQRLARSGLCPIL
mgnify:CR=1 FL=1